MGSASRCVFNLILFNKSTNMKCHTFCNWHILCLTWSENPSEIAISRQIHVCPFYWGRKFATVLLTGVVLRQVLLYLIKYSQHWSLSFWSPTYLTIIIKIISFVVVIMLHIVCKILTNNIVCTHSNHLIVLTLWYMYAGIVNMDSVLYGFIMILFYLLLFR